MNVTRQVLRDHALLPLEELHPENICAFCAYRGGPMKRVVVRSTLAWGYMCLDSVRCLRRRQRQAA